VARYQPDRVVLKDIDGYLRGRVPGEVAQVMRATLEAEGVAYDIGSYKDAPPGIRIWCGATVEQGDLQALMPWLAWAYEQIKS